MNPSKNTFSLRGIGIFLVLLIVTGAYFVSHKPLTGTAFMSLLITAYRFLAAFLILLGSGGLGVRLLSGLNLNPGVRLTVQASLGAGVLAVFFMLIGTTIGVFSWLSWMILISCMVLFRIEIRQWLNDLKQFASEAFRSLEKVHVIAGLVIVGLFIPLFRAAAPPLKFDSLVYHLALPETYIASGKISYVAENAFWGMPQLGEMLFTWVISLTNAVESGAILGWMMGILALIGVGAYAKDQFGGSSGWIAAAIFLAGATSLSSLAWAYVDWLSFLYGFCVLVFLNLSYSDDPSRRRKWIVITGVMAGFAIGTKYSAGTGLLSAFVLVSLVRFEHEGFKQRIRYLLLLGAAGLAAAFPFLLKNLLATGNPAYPFLFPSAEMTPLRLEMYNALPPWGGLENLFLLPFMATFTGHEGAPGYGASLGPLLLAFSLFAGLGLRMRPLQEQKFLRRLILFSTAGLVIWAAAGRLAHYLIQPRLYFVLFPAFCLLGAAGFNRIANFRWPGVRLGRISRILIVFVLGLNVYQLASDLVYSGALQVLLNLQNGEAYQNDNLGMHSLAMQVVNELPADAYVVMLFEPRSLSCASKCDPDEFLDRWTVDAVANNYDIDRMIETWENIGVSHVLLHKFGATFLSESARISTEDWQLLEEFQHHLDPRIDLNQIYLLYELP